MVMWRLRWGRHIEVLELRAKHKGGNFPHLAEKPEMKFGDSHYLDAFYSLHHARRYDGMSGPQSIAISEIKDYLDLIGEDHLHERRRYLQYIQRMDVAVLNYMAEQQKLTMPKQPSA